MDRARRTGGGEGEDRARRTGRTGEGGNSGEGGEGLLRGGTIKGRDY